MPRAGTGPEGLEQQIERILAAEERLEKARAKALEIMDRVENMVDTLENHDQKRVIRLRYIDGMTWDQLARETHWSERTVYRIHGAALEELRRTHGNELEENRQKIYREKGGKTLMGINQIYAKLKEKIVTAINESGLPMIMVADILDLTLREVRSLAERQLQEERKREAEAILQKAQKDDEAALAKAQEKGEENGQSQGDT